MSHELESFGGQEVRNKRQMSKEQQYADDAGEVGQALGNTPLWEQPYA